MNWSPSYHTVRYPSVLAPRELFMFLLHLRGGS
jgi:hypothetical protein